MSLELRVTKALFGYKAVTEDKYFNDFDWHYVYKGTGYGRTREKAIAKALDNQKYERLRVKGKYEREIVRLDSERSTRQSRL